MVENNRAVTPANLRWNASMIVLNGTMFGLVETLMRPSLVLVVFLSQLTQNPVILGMPMALWTGGFMLSQLAVAGYVQQQRIVLPRYRWTSLVRVLLWFGLILTVTFVRTPTVLILVMLLFLLLYPLMWGVAGMMFFEIVSKTIPPRMRGMVFSWRLVGSGIVALGGGWLVNQLLAPDFWLSFPQNFALLFAIGGVVVIIGMLFFHFVREPEGQAIAVPEAGLRGRWDEIRAVWARDRLFRHYVLARTALLLAAGTAPLIVVYARSVFGLPLEAAAAFLIADTITGLVVVAVSGWLSARFGNQWLARVAALLCAAAFLLIVVAGVIRPNPDLAYWYFMVVFMLLAAFTSTSSVSFVALNLNIPPEDQRPLYIGLANTIFGLVSYASIAQGFVVSLVGYGGLFVLALGLAVVGLWQVVAFLYDPAEQVSPADAHA